MAGRLIVALLVIASAAFVMLQKRESESTNIEASLADTKAREAARRSAELQTEITALKEQVIALEDKLERQAEHLGELADDCRPAAPANADVDIASFQRRPPAGDLVGPRETFRSGRVDQRFSALLRGEPATITRARIYPSLDDATPLRGFAACDTAETDDVASLLGVFADGKVVSGDLGRQGIEKRRGVMPLELRCDLELDPRHPLTFEVVLAGGGTVRATLPPVLKPTAPTRAPRP